MTSHKVLIVEDETKLLSHLNKALSHEGYLTSTCTSFSDLESLVKIPVKQYDVIVLDRLLHGHDAASLIHQIKQSQPEVKLLVLSAIDTPAEKAQVINLGADDYVAKPFNSDELIARLRALMRRTLTELRFGNVILNSEKRTVKINDQEIGFQEKEFILLRALLRSPGKVFNHISLYQHVRSTNAEDGGKIVDVTINSLKRKLAEQGATFSIKSMRDKGYWVEE